MATSHWGIYEYHDLSAEKLAYPQNLRLVIRRVSEANSLLVKHFL